MLVWATAHPEAPRKDLELLVVLDFSVLYLCLGIICTLDINSKALYLVRYLISECLT